jgi:hypothetical protein
VGGVCVGGRGMFLVGWIDVWEVGRGGEEREGGEEGEKSERRGGG